MRHHDGFETLLADFGISIGLSELAFDQKDMCSICIDDACDITFLRNYERYCLTIAGLLSEAGDNLTKDVAVDLLKVNVNLLYEHGHAVGLDAQSNNLMLFTHIPLSELDQNKLKDKIVSFVEKQKHLMKVIAEMKIGVDAFA
jgi:hypothetical protein